MLVEASEWDYSIEGPDEWPHLFASCGGTKQSPINVITTQTVYDPSLAFMNFFNYDNYFIWNMTFNNHTGMRTYCSLKLFLIILQKLQRNVFCQI